MPYVFRGFEGEVKEGAEGAETTIALAQGITIEVAAGTEPVREVGARHPVEFKQGNEEITGTIERLHWDNRFITTLSADYPSEKSIVTKATGSDGTTFTITLKGVHFPSLSIEMPAEDFVTESVDFVASGIVYS